MRVTDNSQFDEAFETIKKAYIDRTAKQLLHLDTFKSLLQKNSLSNVILVELIPFAHSFSGSGTTFGFPSISDAGRELEKTLRAIQDKKEKTLGRGDAKTIITLLEKLKDACECNLNTKQKLSNTDKTPPKVLVADDDDLIREIVRQQLRPFSFDIITAGDGIRTLELAQREKPDLIILDANMPKKDGFEVLKDLKRIPDIKNIPVIMLTGKKEEPDIMRGFSEGVIDYITKPFNPKELGKRIATVLKNSVVKILVADDDELVLQLLSYRIKQSGFTIFTTAEGGKVIDTALANTPDIIILDVMMPDVDGFTILKQLKENSHTRNIPVILLTARNQGSDITKGMQLGANDYIAKPFVPEELLARIDRLLKQ